MNKHLIQSRLKSYQYYNSEISRLEEAISQTKATQRELLKEFDQVKPLNKGDIVLDGKTVLVFIKQDPATVSTYGENKDRPFIKLHFRKADGYGKLELTGPTTQDTYEIYYIDSPIEFNVVGNILPKEAESESSNS